VRVPVAQYPAATMKIEHHRQDFSCAGRPNDPDWHRSGGADREGDILDLGARLADRRRLCPLQHRPRVGGRQGVDRRRAGQAVDELLRVGLQRRLGRIYRIYCHEGSPLVRCGRDPRLA
jgi:hypothetical protein